MWRCWYNLLPTARALLNVGIIAFWVAAMVPITRLVLLKYRRDLLDVNRRCCRHNGQHGDGKVYFLDVIEGGRISTGERTVDLG